MKLELKHLAAYLHMRINPLKIQYKNGIYTLDGLNGAWNVDIRQAMMVTENVHIENIKPILNPLYNITKSLQDIKWQVIEKHLISGRDIGSFRYDDISKLIDNHFDVFDLIDAGLAIDLNTLKP